MERLKSEAIYDAKSWVVKFLTLENKLVASGTGKTWRSAISSAVRKYFGIESEQVEMQTEDFDESRAKIVFSSLDKVLERLAQMKWFFEWKWSNGTAYWVAHLMEEDEILILCDTQIGQTKEEACCKTVERLIMHMLDYALRRREGDPNSKQKGE